MCFNDIFCYKMGLNNVYSNPLNSKGIPAVSHMSGSPTFDIDKKKQKQGKFKTLPRPTDRRSN